MNKPAGNAHAAAIRFTLCLIIFIAALFAVMDFPGFWKTVGYVAAAKIAILALWPSQADGDALLDLGKDR